MASHFVTLKEAKAEFKKRTGQDFENSNKPSNVLTIYRRKKSLKRRYFVGSYMEWLNL